MSFSWLSSPQGGQQQQQQHQPQFADVSRFQSMKHQLENFREATDPTIAATLGFAESGFVHPQPTNQNNINNRSVSSGNQDPRRSVSATSSQQPTNRSNSVLHQPPGLSPSASRGTSMDRNYNNSQHQNQNQQTQQQQLMRPPTVVQADGSFRFVVPPPPPSGQPAPRPHLQNNHNHHYLHDDEQDPNSFHHHQQQNRQQQEIQTVSLKASTNPNVMLPQRPDQHDHHHFVNQQNQQQTPGADISAIHVVNHQHNISSSATPGMTSKNLFGQQQHHQHHHDPNQQQQNDEHVQEKVQVQEKPPWVGPLDQQPQQNSASASYSPRATSPAPRTGIRSSNKNRRSRSTSSCPMCESESRSSRKQKKEEVHLIQDGRRVIYKGTTHQRLTEESLYTGQSKFRFAWKQQFQPTVPVSTFNDNDDDDYDQQRQHIHEYHQQNDNSSVVVDESALYNNRESHYGDSEEDDYYFHHHHGHHSNVTTTPSAKSHTGSTTTPTSKSRQHAGGGRSTPIQALSVKHYRHFQQEQPKVLDLMNGTAIAAEQLRRAKTEGERRTAETLMRRQAFKALHPEVLEWKDKTWQDSLRPSAKSGRGGADNYDDAKNFSMYHKDRPQWRFPARQGPTMKELREAPMVVSLTLEDLKVTPVEERVMEHMSSQRRGRAQQHNHQNTSVNPNALVYAPKIHRADEPPPTPVTSKNNTPNIEMQHLQQEQQKNNINNPHQHHLSYSEKHREIQKSLPPDASSFLVREPPGLKLSKKNWSASPIPSTPKENEIPSSQQQQQILIKNQQQNSSTGGLKSTTNRSVRDVMASFGDPNKSIKDAQREQEELSGQILNELYFQREKEAKAALQQQEDHLKKVKTDNVYKYRVATRDSNHDDDDHFSSFDDHDEVFTNSRATSLGAVSNSIASAQLKIHNLSGAKIRAVVKDDSVYSDL